MTVRPCRIALLLLLLATLSSVATAFQLGSNHNHRPSSSSIPRRRSSLDDDAVLETDDDEWHPHDPANTIPQLMEAVWSQIAQAGGMVKGVRTSLSVYVWCVVLHLAVSPIGLLIFHSLVR
jgi:hypothetical protein